MRTFAGALASALALVALGVSGHADDPNCGTIDTTDAVIETGTAPTQGLITQDACAREDERPVIPEMPPLGAIGTFTEAQGTYVPPPDISPAVPEDFHPTVSQTLAAGEHVFASITVDPGLVVVLADGAEAWTTGDVTVHGILRFNGEGKLHCGGNLTVEGENVHLGYEALVTTSAAGGPVDIQVGGNLSVLMNGRLYSNHGGMRLETFGPPPASGSVLITGIIWCGGDSPYAGEDLRIHASGDIRIQADYIDSDYGATFLRSYGGDVEFDAYGGVEVAGSTGDATPPAVIEAAGAVRFLGGSWISAPTLRISAFGGDVLVRDSKVDAGSRWGHAWARAAGSVVVEGDSRFQLGDGHEPVDVTAFGGSVRSQDYMGTAPRFELSGDTAVVAARDDAVLNGDVTIESGAGVLAVRAYGGAVRCADELDLGTSVASTGGIEIHGSERVELPLGSSGYVSAEGTGDIRVLAGAGGVSVDLRDINVFQAGLWILAEGPVVLDTDVSARRAVSVVSTRSWVDAPWCTLTTRNAVDDAASGPIVVESWAGASGRVDVSNATLRTGTSTTQSGDVVLRVVQAGGAAELDSYLLPKVVKTKLGKKDVEDSLMTFSGDLDLGTTGPDLTDPVTLRLGDRTFDLPGLTPSKKGNQLTYRDDVLDVKVTTDLAGSSRGKFTIKLRGDPADVGNPDGTLPLGLSCGDMDARCAVALTGGGFKRGKVRGAVVEPPVRLDKVKVVVKGAGKDKLSLKMSLNTGTQTPSSAPEVELGIGDDWTVVLPGDRFKAKKETFGFKGDESGLKKVTLDYGKEALSVTGKGLDLGPHVGPDGLLRLRVRVAGEEFALRVRLRTKGAAHSY